MPIDKNIYIDVTSVPGGQNKKYNIFVFREVFQPYSRIFASIEKKVSVHSEFKEVAKKLSDGESWNRGKPESISNYKRDDKKYFCELTVDEISALRKMIYAYKSKFGGGTLIMGNAEVQRDSPMKTLIAKAVKFGKLRGSNTAQNKESLNSELSRADNIRKNAEQEKFKKSLDECFKKQVDKVNNQTAEILKNLNPLLYPGDRIEYNDVALNSFKNSNDGGNGAETLRIFDEKLKLYSKKYDGETGKYIAKLLDIWMQSVGVKINNGVRAYAHVYKYLDAGYRIISVLGSGGMAVVVKFLNEKGKERALKIFYNKDYDYDDEVSAIKAMSAKLGKSKGDPNKKSVMKKRFNAPKIRDDGELEMKLANKVLDSDEFVNRRGKKSNLTIDFFKRLSRQVLKGLKALHDAGKVHGDIKPDNIHMMANGKFKIADVGTVCDAEKGTVNTPIYTHPGWDGETARHITVEQKKKNDVYALGCSLLDILCGERLDKYVGFNESSILNKVKSQFINESMNEKNIKELLRFVSKLCAKELDKVPTVDEALKENFVKRRVTLGTARKK